MTPTTKPRTLAERLDQGKLPVGEALHFAMTLADALRRMHDGGRVYGALTPSNIGLTGTASVDLADAPEHTGSVTPYTAPEVLQGKPADARSDIFAFGAILFEMLTGRRAFEGDSEASLTAALTDSAPPSSGSPLVDRLVASCVAKDPAVRCQRMQKIIMELKLLSVAARRAETPAPNRAQTEAQLRAEMHQLEARAASRMASHERATAQMQEAHEKALAQLREDHQTSLTQMQEAAGDVNTLRGQLAEVGSRIVEVEGRLAQPIAEVRAMVDQIVARVEHAIEPLGRRIADVEETLQQLSNRSAVLQENLAADLNGIEQSLAQHAAAIDSARTAMAQTDDLVERVVEALELLQSSVLDQREERAVLID
ncbi:MAG: protein kinase [Bryobacteraceae bacterium]|jgi:predicted  nucleic acid-binding Zn-ribbon protein